MRIGSERCAKKAGAVQKAQRYRTKAKPCRIAKGGIKQAMSQIDAKTGAMASRKLPGCQKRGLREVGGVGTNGPKHSRLGPRRRRISDPNVSDRAKVRAASPIARSQPLDTPTERGRKRDGPADLVDGENFQAREVGMLESFDSGK